ncbi:MAG: glycosyltransferase [Azospirillaceae bacterium]|nr:glycosyltransferase [Azospirillaceae bacterium]
MAATFEGQHFDIVDLPDYYTFGLYLFGALDLFGISYDRLVLSMHGPMTMSVWLNWSGTPPPEIAQSIEEGAQLENALYQVVDIRYGISRTFIEARAAANGTGGYYLNPLRLDYLRRLSPSRPAPAAEPPGLLFAARKERWKGAHLYLEMLWWLPRSGYRAAVLAGNDADVGPDGRSNVTLGRMLANRKIDCTLVNQKSWPELRVDFAARNIVVVPSTYDSLNLGALESLLCGCPTAISRFAGVIRFLSDSLPGLPWLMIDPTDPPAATDDLQRLLDGYDDHRAQLVEHLQTRTPIIDGPSLAEIYQSPSRRSTDRAPVIAATKPLLARLLEIGQFCLRETVPGPAAATTPASTFSFRYQPRDSQPTDPRPVAARALAQIPQSAALEKQFRDGIALLCDHYRLYREAPETDAAARAVKRKILYEALQRRLDRGRIFHELGRLAYLDGKGLLGAAYDLRVMRLAGADLFDRCLTIAGVLRQHGMMNEAAAVEALYGDAVAAPARCADFLDQARARCQTLAPVAFERVIDRRTNAAPRVALIVSLYDAAAKMPRFLELLRRQTLIGRGEVEIIFIDSASPRDEWAPIEAAALPQCLYLRTAERETIPQAWNRGIAASRAPYLIFLGADETLRPDALAILADALDAAPSVDWVQASAVVVRTDAAGRFTDDLMAYDRKTVDADFMLVDTTYVGHVPGLYRRTLHDRFGWYDGSFRGASDTEFKMRAFPGFTVDTLEMTLGEYLNYPEPRTTASVAVEIEDLRAWYLPRTAAGIATLLRDCPADRIARLVDIALNHRKCYFDTPSSDVELAAALLAVLKRDDPDHPACRLEPGTAMVLDAYRQLDFLSGTAPVSDTAPESLHAGLQAALAAISRAERDHLILDRTASYAFYNDNRCQQHYWPWEP